MRFQRLLLIAMLSISTAGQAQLLLQPNQFGQPLRLHDFWTGGWERAITLYTDPHQVLLVGDPGSDAGFSGYEKTGVYTAYLWTYYTDDFYCRTTRIPVGHENDPKWVAACRSARYRVREVMVNTTADKVKVLWDCMMGSDADPINGTNLQGREAKDWMGFGAGTPFWIAIGRITAMLPKR